MNKWVLLVFAPVLVLAGVLGFLQHGEGATSATPAYNVFHLAFGAIGLAIVVFATNGSARLFNLAFGLVDLYQALASRMGWFPKDLFRWKPLDDLLHVVIGVALVALGLLG